MEMGVDDVADAHTGLVGGFQIRLDRPQRIDHRGHRLAAAAEQVGDRNRVAVEEGAQDH